MKRKRFQNRKIVTHLLIWVLLIIAVVAISYGLYAAKLVTEKMGGKKWDLPSRIFAAPKILYPGLPFLEEDFVRYMGRQGYLRVRSRPVDTGQWIVLPSGFEVGLRSFKDATQSYPAKRIQISLEDHHVVSLHEMMGEEAKELFTLELEPEKLGEFFAATREQRTLVHLKEIPKLLQQAVIQMEDRTFYQHHGVSIKGIVRAFVHNLMGGQVVEGGSTLTQQLMKNFFLSPERTLSRKIREVMMTLVTEMLYSKDEILEAYLNEIYLGQRGTASIHGVGEASKFYFSKEVAALTLSEQATIAALISSPGKYSPYRDPKAAQARKEVVLKVMLDNHVITKLQEEAARKETIVARGWTKEERRSPYFIEQVRKSLSDQISEERLQSEGLDVFTTLDPLLQELAESAIRVNLQRLEKRNPRIEVALLAIHPKSGAVKAYIGGKNYGLSQFDRVTMTKRQIGSLVKPLIIATALAPHEKEPPVAIPTTVLDDHPSTFSFDGKDWSPKNYDGKYFGSVTVRTALEKSLNVATVNLASRLSLPFLAQELHQFGFESALALPSITLGALNASPWQVAGAYSVLANAGSKVNLQTVIAVGTENDERMVQKTLKMESVISPQIAFVVTHLMTGVVEHGTAQRVRQSGLRLPLAGKTGTTDDNRDSWFAGFTPSLLTLVWVGRDDNAPTGLTGASGALPIWIDFMSEVAKRIPEEAFEEPEGIVWFDVDRERGCVGSTSQEILHEAFIQGTQPLPCR